MSELKFGETVSDTVTGQEGKLTACCEYITGRKSWLIEFIDNDGNAAEEWYDEERLTKNK